MTDIRIPKHISEYRHKIPRKDEDNGRGGQNMRSWKRLNAYTTKRKILVAYASRLFASPHTIRPCGHFLNLKNTVDSSGIWHPPAAAYNRVQICTFAQTGYPHFQRRYPRYPEDGGKKFYSKADKISTLLHGVTSHKAVITIITAMITPDFLYLLYTQGFEVRVLSM